MERAFLPWESEFEILLFFFFQVETQFPKYHLYFLDTNSIETAYPQEQLKCGTNSFINVYKHYMTLGS